MDKQSKSDNILHTLAAAGRIGLMLIGLVGIAVEIFRDNGLLKQFLGKLFNSSYWWVYILITVGVLYFLNTWMASSDGKAASGKGDLPLYIMMAIGAYFLYRIISTGSL